MIQNKGFRRLTTLLSAGGFTGHVTIGAIAGLFKLTNTPMLALMFMAGPGAIACAFLVEGPIRERAIAALVAGGIATTIVTIAASWGAEAAGFLNIKILNIFGGFAVLIIGLLIMGLKIPEKVPLGIMVIGFLLSAIWR